MLARWKDRSNCLCCWCCSSCSYHHSNRISFQKRQANDQNRHGCCLSCHLGCGQCVEVAEAMGTEHEHLIVAVHSDLQVPWRYTNSHCCCCNCFMWSCDFKGRNIAAVIPVVKVTKNFCSR